MRLNNKKKILFINGHMNVGGIEKSLLDLLNHINYEKYDISLLLLEDLGDYVPLINKNIKILFYDTSNVYGPLITTLLKNFKKGNFKNILYRIIILCSRFINPKCYKILNFLLPINKYYDVAIAYRPDECANILAYCINSQKKLLWWHLGDCTLSKKQINKTTIVWKKIDMIITVSKACQQMLKIKFSTLSERIVILPNMINEEELEYASGEVSPFKDKSNLNFVTVSRLFIEKHVENIVDIVIYLIKENITQFKWYIIGDGDLFESIQQKIHTHKLEKWIIMMGRKKNPYPYIKYADILIHTSYIEAQCTTMLESMALKTPCVITKTKNPQDFTIDNYNCLIAEQEISSLSQNLINLINNPALRENLITNAKKTVKDYSPQKTIKNFELLLN